MKLIKRKEMEDSISKLELEFKEQLMEISIRLGLLTERLDKAKLIDHFDKEKIYEIIGEDSYFKGDILQVTDWIVSRVKVQSFNGNDNELFFNLDDIGYKIIVEYIKTDSCKTFIKIKDIVKHNKSLKESQ